MFMQGRRGGGGVGVWEEEEEEEEGSSGVYFTFRGYSLGCSHPELQWWWWSPISVTINNILLAQCGEQNWNYIARGYAG